MTIFEERVGDRAEKTCQTVGIDIDFDAIVKWFDIDTLRGFHMQTYDSANLGFQKKQRAISP